MKAPIPTRVVQDSQTACHTLLAAAASDDIVVVAGSLYLLGEIRPLLAKAAERSDTIPAP